MMNWLPVESKMIAQIGYDEETQVLGIQFASGAIYEYDSIPPEEHEALLNSPSVGKHFNAHIKPQHVGRRS